MTDFFCEGNSALQVITVFAGDTHSISLNAGLHLHLALLEQLDDFFGQLDFYAYFYCAGTLDLVATDLLDFIADV